MNDTVVINLGLPKTGTTTLARALRRACFSVADHRIRPRQTKNTELKNAYVADLLYRGYFETGDPLAYLGDFSALSEISLLRDGRSVWPQTDFALIDAMRKQHPNVKFLASRRDAFKLSQSMLAWSDLGTDRLPNGTVPGLPAGYGHTSKERIRWIEGHYKYLRHIFADDPNFFEYDVSDPNIRNSLGKFLKRDIPWWGRANANRKNRVA